MEGHNTEDEVLDKETHAIDTQVLLAIQHIHTPLLTQFMLGITALGEPSILITASLVMGLLLIWRQRWHETILLIVAAAGAGGLNMLLKDVFARSRPELWDRIVDVRYYSFPSGHAMISMVVYGVLSYLLADQFPRWRHLIFGLSIPLIVLIGFSRLYLGVHWPTDVVAGYAAGFVWLVTCLLSLAIWQRHRDRRALNQEQT